MNFDEYQAAAISTAIYPRCNVEKQGLQAEVVQNSAPWIYPALKLAGETGEICEKLGKIVRDQHGVLPEGTQDAIKKELGDVLWYLAALAKEFDLTLDEVAVANIEKLQSRKDRGVLGGSGDNR